jgi:hypothetical protein
VGTTWWNVWGQSTPLEVVLRRFKGLDGQMQPKQEIFVATQQMAGVSVEVQVAKSTGLLYCKRRRKKEAR